MAVARLVQRVIHVECPACHWTKAVLAYKQLRTRRFFCPRCQHVWDTTETAREVRSSLNHRRAQLRQVPEVSADLDRDRDRRVAEVVTHVRRTLALLNDGLRVHQPTIVRADPAQTRLRERAFKDMLPHDILK